MAMQRFLIYLAPMLLGAVLGRLVADLFILLISLSVVVDYHFTVLLRSLPESIIAGILLTTIAALTSLHAKNRTFTTIAFVSSLVGLPLGLLLTSFAASAPSPSAHQWFVLFVVLAYLLCTALVGSILIGLLTYAHRTRSD